MGTVLLFTVVGSTILLKVKTTLLLTATPVAPFVGLTVATVGRVVSATPEVPVAKLLVNGTTAFPAWSTRPDTFTVYVVLTASKLLGVKISVVLSLLTMIAPATCVPPADTVIALLPTLVTLTAALRTTSTRAFTGTPVAPVGGTTVRTVGRLVDGPVPVVKKEEKPDCITWPCRSVMPPTGTATL